MAWVYLPWPGKVGSHKNDCTQYHGYGTLEKQVRNGYLMCKEQSAMKSQGNCWQGNNVYTK